MAVKISPVDMEERRKLDIRAGDTVRVWYKVIEDAAKGKYRSQAFEGLVLARKHGREPGATFTVRRTASGIGVERIFPLYSPMIDRVELIKRTRVRRAKLYYIRDKAAREARRQLRRTRIIHEQGGAINSPQEQVEVTSEVPETPIEAATEATAIEAEVKVS